MPLLFVICVVFFNVRLARDRNTELSDTSYKGKKRLLKISTKEKIGEHQTRTKRCEIGGKKLEIAL